MSNVGLFRKQSFNNNFLYNLSVLCMARGGKGFFATTDKSATIFF